MDPCKSIEAGGEARGARVHVPIRHQRGRHQGRTGEETRPNRVHPLQGRLFERQIPAAQAEHNREDIQGGRRQAANPLHR